MNIFVNTILVWYKREKLSRKDINIGLFLTLYTYVLILCIMDKFPVDNFCYHSRNFLLKVYQISCHKNIMNKYIIHYNIANSPNFLLISNDTYDFIYILYIEFIEMFSVFVVLCHRCLLVRCSFQGH